MPNEPDDLRTIFLFIATNWKTGESMTRPQFDLAVRGQVAIDAAYLLYYSQTEAAYHDALRQAGGDQQKALALLYSSNTYPNPQQPNVAKILGEFMRWHIAFGGFQSFGYENYPGWMGGSTFTAQPPPYRTAGDK